MAARRDGTVNIIVRFAVVSVPAYPRAGLKWKAGLSPECRHEHAGEHQKGRNCMRQRHRRQSPVTNGAGLHYDCPKINRIAITPFKWGIFIAF
jgi:hypothetical protein